MTHKPNYNPDIHHRRSIRLREYDYGQAGAYFVTICAHNCECFFGDIVAGAMRLNEYGGIVRDEWKKSEQIRAEIASDAFVVMPNHFHGIVFIVAGRVDRFCGGDRPVAPTGAINGPKPKSIGALVAGFKSAVTKSINTHRATPGAPVWQRNYYEHVIRNDDDLNRIRDYIASNPLRWMEDENNPAIL